MKISTKNFLLLTVAVAIIIIIFIFIPKNKNSHLFLLQTPLSTEPPGPSGSLLFNTFTENIDMNYILNYNNLLYGLKKDQIIDLQTKAVYKIPQNLQQISVNSAAILFKDSSTGNLSYAHYPFNPSGFKVINTRFESPVINSAGTKIIECTSSPKVYGGDKSPISAKIKDSLVRCLWVSKDLIIIQGGKTAFIWDTTIDKLSTISVDDSEIAIYGTEDFLFTNKGGVLGIRNINSVGGIPFHVNSLLYVVTFNKDLGAAIIFEVTKGIEGGRGYIYDVRINSSLVGTKTLIGSTHPIPEWIDPLFIPIYLEKNAIIILRTISGKYWLGSLTPSKLPYLTTTGPELYEPSSMIYSEDISSFDSSFSE